MLLSDDYVEVVVVGALSRVNALLFMQVIVVVVNVVESMHTHIELGAYALLNV